MFRHLPWSHGIWFATDTKNITITRSNFHFLSAILRESESWAQSGLKTSTPQGWRPLPSLPSSKTSPWPPPSRPATRDHQALTTHCKAIVAAEPPHGFFPFSEGQDLLNMMVKSHSRLALTPSSSPPRAPPSQVVVVDLLPFQGVSTVLYPHLWWSCYYYQTLIKSSNSFFLCFLPCHWLVVSICLMLTLSTNVTIIVSWRQEYSL